METAIVGMHQVLKHGAPLAAQWLRTCLTMRGILVLSLGWEDPACRRTARPLHHPGLCSRASKPMCQGLCARTLEPVLHKRGHLEEPTHFSEGEPPLSTAGEACTAVRAQHGRKYKKSLEKKYHDVIAPTPVAYIS